jgi:hypothetical protein
MGKAGRPFSENPKGHVVCIRLTESEFKMLKTYAAETNQTMTQILHRAVENLDVETRPVS